MTYLTRIVATALLIASSIHGSIEGDEPELAPRPGVLVLRSDRVLRGDITQIGDRYVVTCGKQDEIGVPVESVAMRCATMLEAYARKRDALPFDATARQHLELGDWCLRYDLIPAAAEQLMAAVRLEPGAAANELFEKRLRLAACRPIVPVANRSQAQLSGSQIELDRLLGEMPEGTVEQFTTSIQPLLLNRCGRCHGSHSTSAFHLLRPLRGHALPRRYTQRNLHSVVSLVDRQRCDESPLLVMSRQAHGGSKQPVFPDAESIQMKQLIEWVYEVAGQSSSLKAAELGSPAALLLQPDGRRSTNPTELADASTIQGGQPVPQHESDDPERSESGSVASQPEAPEVVPPNRVPPGTDPFDPEVFNRRYLRR